jgi:hypothetical protein
MSVHVKLSPLLYRYVHDYDPRKGIIIEEGSGKTIRQIIYDLEIPSEMMSSILVNHLPAKLITLVKDGDHVMLLRILGGG